MCEAKKQTEIDVNPSRCGPVQLYRIKTLIIQRQNLI